MIPRPALRWYGSKWRDAPRIIEHFPAHVCYLEPFGGAGSVLLRKPRSRFEYYNDRHGELVTFFRVLRDSPQELCRLIASTPFSREEMELARKSVKAENDLETARRVAVLSWQSVGGHLGYRSGWRFQRRDARNKSAIRDWIELPGWLGQVAERLRTVSIECDDALKVVRRYDSPGTLIYCDPPYLFDCRNRRQKYTVEFGRPEDHEVLAEALHGLEAMVLLSGYESDLYRRLFADWSRVSWDSLTNGSTDGKAVRRREILWMNPAAVAAQAQMCLPLKG